MYLNPRLSELCRPTGRQFRSYASKKGLVRDMRADVVEGDIVPFVVDVEERGVLVGDDGHGR